MPADLHSLEESLKEFLIEAQNDPLNKERMSYYKYNNLRITMDPKRQKAPHFTVRVGISEAMFSLEDSEKISGGLGVDEKYVHRWFEKQFIQAELNESWRRSSEIEPIVMKNPDDLLGR